jgi:hypothetical protein
MKIPEAPTGRTAKNWPRHKSKWRARRARNRKSNRRNQSQETKQ